MPTHCAAFGCTNSSRKESCKNKGISFHKFPLTDKILLGRWLVNVRRADFQPTQYSYICSEHFTEEDFEYQPFTNRRGLKKGVIPTRFSYNFHKSGHRKKQGISRKNQKPEMHGEDYTCEPVLIGNDMESNEVQCALVEISMNEKFYSPKQLEALGNDSAASTRLKQKSSHAVSERIAALKESLHAKILLRSLKKQLLNAEIKATNAKRDYYEAKKAMSQVPDVLDSDDSSESETDSPLEKIKSKMEEEELAAQIEEKMLQKQLEEVQMHAANCEKEYYETKYEAKSSISSFS
ncbi:THAP domain-containing protein 1-like [Argiope bruennichi]|nr:THAP domain-containing protein 1-like [Argiope bruennichi]